MGCQKFVLMEEYRQGVPSRTTSDLTLVSDLYGSGANAAWSAVVASSYFGLVIAPSDADETKAAYFANTPVGNLGCGAFQCAMR